MVCYSELIPEKFLHEVFAHRRTGGEWFSLNDKEIEIITKMMKSKNKTKADALMRMCFRQLKKNKPTRKELNTINQIKENRKFILSYDKAVFTFGKYKGLLIKDMKSESQRNYLYWAYHNLGNLDKTIKSAIKIQLEL